MGAAELRTGKLLQSPVLGSKRYAVDVQRLRRLHTSFVTLCESFALTKAEFMWLFQDENLFYAFDTDKNDVVDMLEVFAGLGLLSTSELSDRLACKRYSVLFELVDFNREGWIAGTDLLLMMSSCVTAVFKLCKLGMRQFLTEVAAVVEERFALDQKVTLRQMAELVNTNTKVAAFLQNLQRLSA